MKNKLSNILCKLGKRCGECTSIRRLDFLASRSITKPSIQNLVTTLVIDAKRTILNISICERTRSL